MNSDKEKAHKIVDMLINDIRNRRGLGNEWNRIDLDIKDEIKKTWREEIYKILHPLKNRGNNETSGFSSALREFLHQKE